MRFDAYAGTIRERSLVEVAEGIQSTLGARILNGNAMRRYGQVLNIDLQGRQAAWVGYDKANESVYFEGKGETSPALVECIRAKFPEHQTARADVCEDYDEPGAFELLVDTVRQHKGDRVKGAFVNLPDDPSDGRTWCAGVRGGVAFMRVYEAGKMAERRALGRPNWARAELEARPHYARDKIAAATMSPIEFWGYAAWSQRVGQALAKVPIPRFEPALRDGSFDKTTEYLAKTFRRHWMEMLSDFGDWECIGREMQEIWAADDALKRLQQGRSS